MIRTLVLCCLLLASGLSRHAAAQETPGFDGGVIYLSYQPADHGIGVRVDHINLQLCRLYSSVSYGSWGAYRVNGLRNHVKITIGGMIPLGVWRESLGSITAGLNCHYAESESDGVNGASYLINRPLSFELGFTMRLRRFAISGRTDILRWEPCVDIGIPF